MLFITGSGEKFGFLHLSSEISTLSSLNNESIRWKFRPVSTFHPNLKNLYMLAGLSRCLVDVQVNVGLNPPISNLL